MGEPYLGKPGKTAEILKKYHFIFQKRFGQNFLIDSHVLEKIVREAGITKDDFVLEIGPGIGNLTQYLAQSAGAVTAVEIDSMLIPILEDTLKEWDNVTLIQGDVLKIDLSELIKEKSSGRPVKIVANLPYYITTPIIMSIFENHLPVESVTVMVQKEVAERMVSGPGSRDYGAFSLAVQYYSNLKVVANVPPNCFLPRPKVGSAVVRMDLLPEPAVKVKDESLLFALIRASFQQRRKTLPNSIKNSGELSFTREEVEQALEKCGLSPQIRGEALTLEEFARLSDELKT